MVKVLLPIDLSDRSLQSIDRFKRDYTPEEAEVTLLTVVDTAMHFKTDAEYDRYREKRMIELDEIFTNLEGYMASKVILRGNPAGKIVDYAETNKFDVMIITRAKRGALGKMGSVASQIVRQAPNLELLILREG